MKFHESQSLSSLKLLFNYFLPAHSSKLSRSELISCPVGVPGWKCCLRCCLCSTTLGGCIGDSCGGQWLWSDAEGVAGISCGILLACLYWYWYIILYPAGPWHVPWNFPHGVGGVSLSTATGRGIASSQIEFVTGVGEWQLRSFVKF